MLANVNMAQDRIGGRTAQAAFQPSFGIRNAKARFATARTWGVYPGQQFFGRRFDYLHPGRIVQCPHVRFHINGIGPVKQFFEGFP